MTYLHTNYKNMAVSKMHWTVSCENKQQYDLSLNMQSCLTIPVKEGTSELTLVQCFALPLDRDQL